MKSATELLLFNCVEVLSFVHKDKNRLQSHEFSIHVSLTNGSDAMQYDEMQYNSIAFVQWIFFSP